MGLCSISGTLGMDASGLPSNMHNVRLSHPIRSGSVDMSRMFEYRMSINPGQFHRTTYFLLISVVILLGTERWGYLLASEK